MPSQRIQAKRNQIAGKQLSERRRYRLKKTLFTHELKISVHGIFYRGQHSFATHDVLSSQTGSHGQLNPTLDAAGLPIHPIVIFDPFPPCPPKTRIIAPRENDRVLYRNDALVVVTV